jgi:hypothetical protein
VLQPLRSKDWEQALLEFLLALLISPSVGMQQQAPVTQRLKEVTCPGSMPLQSLDVGVQKIQDSIDCHMH